MSHERAEGLYQEPAEGLCQEPKGVGREEWGEGFPQARRRLKDQVEPALGQMKQFVGGVTESLGSALRTVRQDPSMTQAATRRAALKLLAYVAGTLIVVNEIVRAPRRRRKWQLATHL